jgi:hypothetical protein
VERAVTCDDCDLLLAAHAVGALDPRDDEALQHHLTGCSECRSAAAAYLQGAALLPFALEPLTPPPELRSRLLAQVHAEAAGQAPAPPPRVPWWTRLWRALPAARGLTLLGGLAAAAAAVLAVWSFAIPHGPPAAPAVLVSHACGLTPMPSACGELTYAPAVRKAMLTVRGLPALAEVNNQTVGAYAVWLIHRNGTAVLGAYLSPAPDGATWAAVLPGDIASYEAVATTHEPRPGGVVPTGPELLRIARPAPPTSP